MVLTFSELLPPSGIQLTINGETYKSRYDFNADKKASFKCTAKETTLRPVISWVLEDAVLSNVRFMSKFGS